jgi:hypothetical protein
VHFASRFDQIHFKLYAAVDQGAGRHEADLRALGPTTDQLLTVARWTRLQDRPRGSSSRYEVPFEPLESMMQISTLREELAKASLAFAWDQWAQMGVLATPRRWDRWTMDPEALIVFSLEVARRDPRLFDEILDWMLVNERLVSVQRLRNLSRKVDERSLVDAALSWVASWKPRARLDRRGGPTEPGPTLVPLFHGMPARGPALDDAFRAHGFAKPPTEPTQKSRPPDVDAPVNFVFRLRNVLGVSVRAEVMRCLLTIHAPRVSVQVIARSAGYSKRNVQEALNSLRAAHVISGITLGGEQGYSADHGVWSPLFRFASDDWPVHRDWPQLLGALVRILRWLDDPQTAELSDYMRASKARDLLEQVADDLLFAGVPVERVPPGSGEEAWASFVSTARNAMSALAVSPRP